MRRLSNRISRSDDAAELNLTPMLDVVFIMLIFFIVTATFIRQAGAEVIRPEADTAEEKRTVSLLVAVTTEGEIWIDNKRVDVNSLQPVIERLHAENPRGSMIVQADRGSRVEVLMQVLDAARAAGMNDVAVSTRSRS